MSLLSLAKKIAGREANKEIKKKVPVVTKTTKGNEALVQSGLIRLTALVTEKGVNSQYLSNAVIFKVKPNVSKGEIAQAVREKYGITPVAVRTLSVRPRKRKRGRTVGWTSAWKKAYVTLPEGKTIDLTA